MNSREPGCMSNKEFLELLERDIKCGDTLYTRFNNNYPYISQEQLSLYVQSLLLKIGDYINNITLEQHLFNDVSKDLKEVFESEAYQDEQR